MADRLRTAIIGCGAIGCRNDRYWWRNKGEGFPLTHAGAYRANPTTALVAAADINQDRLEGFGQEWGVTALYSDFRKMLDKERVEVLSICTPTAWHAEMVREACVRGVRAVFCEKPLASDTREALAAIHACERSRIVLAVNYFRRWNATIEVVAGELASGSMGRIRRVNAFYTRGIRNNGTHALDLIHWLVGPIRTAQAVRFESFEDGDFSVDALCLSEGEVPCYLHACRQADFNIFEVDIMTDWVRLRITENGRRIERYEVKPDDSYEQYRILKATPQVITTAWEACFVRAVEDLITCVRTGGKPRCGSGEAYNALVVAEAIVRSAQCGGQQVSVTGAVATDSALAFVREGEG